MWARAVEICLACWLAISPFIFGYAGDDLVLWAVGWASAAAITTVSLLSFKRSIDRMHLWNFLIAGLLVGVSFTTPSPPPPAYQNFVVVGVLLFVFAIVPSYASDIPRGWAAFYGESDPRKG
jgi:hypothetical protein